MASTAVSSHVPWIRLLCPPPRLRPMGYDPSTRGHPAILLKHFFVLRDDVRVNNRRFGFH